MFAETDFDAYAPNTETIQKAGGKTNFRIVRQKLSNKDLEWEIYYIEIELRIQIAERSFCITVL